MAQMTKKFLGFLISTILVISYGNLYALDLEVSPNLIEFGPNAAPIELGLRVFDKGKPVRWDSKRLKALSSKITVVNTEGESLGLESAFGLKFIPIGASDGLTYRLIGVVDRSIQFKTTLQVTINIASKPGLKSMLSVTIPNSNESIVGNTIKESEARRLLDDLAIVKNNTGNTLSWVTGVGLLLVSFLFGLATLYMTLTKSNTVTKEVGISIKQLQERQSALMSQQQERESNSIKLQQSEFHHELHKQGMDILSSTGKVYATASELVRVTNQIDSDIGDFAKKPFQADEKVKKNVKELKKLVKDITLDSKSSNEELSVWIEHSPDAVVAGVIRGTPPLSLRETFSKAAEEIQYYQEADLIDFDGNADVFDASRPILERCLEFQANEEKESSGT